MGANWCLGSFCQRERLHLVTTDYRDITGSERFSNCYCSARNLKLLDNNMSTSFPNSFSNNYCRPYSGQSTSESTDLDFSDWDFNVNDYDCELLLS